MFLYIQCVYTPLFNPGHILIDVAHIQMYREKNYQENYETSVNESLERKANLGGYAGATISEQMKMSDFPVLSLY